MTLKQLLINQLNVEIDADMMTMKRITTLLRELLSDEDARDREIEEIKKLPQSRLHQYSILYLVLLNEKDIEDGVTGRYVGQRNNRNWTSMNRDVQKFNAIYNQTELLSGENEDNLYTRVLTLFRDQNGAEFRHRDAWLFLKDKYKWKNLESTQARRTRGRVTGEEEPEMFGEDAIPQQIQLDREAKKESLDRELAARLAVVELQKRNEDLKILTFDTTGMNPEDAVRIEALKEKARATCVLVGVVVMVDVFLSHRLARRFQRLESSRVCGSLSKLAMVLAKATIDSLRRDGFDVGGRVYEGWSG
ncbi:hypothetical protein Tco_0835714 [Tanacetum coccineum]